MGCSSPQRRFVCLQGFDGRVDVQNPRGAQRSVHAAQELGYKPGPALLGAHARQRATQRVFADNFLQSQNLRTHCVTSYACDVGVAVVPGQYSQQPCAQYDEVLSRIFHTPILEVAHHALRVLFQHRHMLIRGST